MTSLSPASSESELHWLSRSDPEIPTFFHAVLSLIVIAPELLLQNQTAIRFKATAIARSHEVDGYSKAILPDRLRPNFSIFLDF